MSSVNSWNYSVPTAAPGSTKVFNRVITSRTDSGRFYEKRGEESFPLIPVGSLIAFGGTSAPGGYLICNGAEVDRVAFADLFAIIGTRYGEGDGSTTFNVPRLSGPSTGGAVSIAVGHTVDKDMSVMGIDNLPGEYSPDGNGVAGGSTDASYWDDWNDDIFDEWGFFYLFNPATNAYQFLTLTDVNLADGVMATQTVSAFGGRTFVITHGYCAQGIYRFEIVCTSDSLPFRFGAYGNMGSDESTVNVNIDGTLTVGGNDYSFTYNKNQEAEDAVEIFYAYFVPFEPNELGSYGKTYNEYVNGDDTYFYTREYTNGMTVYFSKKNDVITFLNADLRLLNGKIRPGAVNLDDNGSPVLGTPSSYIIKC